MCTLNFCFQFEEEEEEGEEGKDRIGKKIKMDSC